MEQRIIFIKNRNGFQMSVRLTIPKQPMKLAFIEHGLSGSKDENHMIILENQLSEHGYFVVSLDATNSLNDSESSPKGITFTGHYNDLEDVIDWAEKQIWFRKPFTLAGHSMGAASALLYAQNHPDNVDLLLPLSFPWLNSLSRLAQHNPQEMIEWKKNGYLNKISKSKGKTLQIPYDFVEDLEQYDFGLNLNRITAKTILIIGSMENKIRLKDNQKLFEKLTCEKEIIILADTPHALAQTPETAQRFQEALAKILAKFSAENNQYPAIKELSL